MDYKVKQYQSFCGEYLQTNVKISQKVIDEMGDADLMKTREIVSKFESELFWFLKDYAVIVAAREFDKEHGKNYEETSEETSEETIEENPASSTNKRLKKS